MYLIVAPGYPDEQNVNRFAYIHSRVRLYKEHKLDFQVFVLKENENYRNEYQFEGISVITGDKFVFKQFVEENPITKILVQLISIPIMSAINLAKNNIPIYIWFHGFEALSWKRRLFYLNTSDIYSVPRFIKYIFNNRKQLNSLSNFMNINKKRIHAIAVSNWMKNVVESDVKSNNLNWSIIPNIIDGKIFNYNSENKNDRKKILLVRSFESKKYANDISIEFIKELSKKDYFNELEILIVGKGLFFNKLTEKVKKFNNVTIKNVFLNHYELAKLYKEYGVFLCPTRQDSQGVSMCEAMASGVIPLTSNNTAIPEFVDDSSGFMCKNVQQMLDSYEKIYENEKEFLEMSKKASETILNKCSYDNTVAKEIELILS